MRFHKQIKKVVLCLCLIFLMGMGSVAAYASGSSQQVAVAVVMNPNIDLVLTTGISDVDLSNFEEDLLDALEARGIGTQNTDMVEISAIETTSASLESTSVDFASVVNSWQTVGADTWSANDQGQIFSKVPGGKNKPSWWGTALINPTGFEINDLQASFTLVNGGNLNEGFCFNVTQNADGSLNGYFISYSNHSNTIRALFRFDHYTLDQGFDSGINNVMWCYSKNAASWSPGGKGSYGADSYTCLAQWTDSGSNIAYEVTCKDGKIVIKDNGKVVANVTDATYPQGTYGFWGNNCEVNAFSYVSNLKITATKIVSKDYAQVLLEPSWRDSAAHFVVNVEDPVNDSLNSAEALARTLADGIHFIQWGTNENKASAQEFISKNDNNGIFTDNGNYQAAINATADYIKKVIDRLQQSNAQYVIVGENVELVVSPESLKNGAVSQLFPTGRWLVHHDENYFANSEGKSSATEVFQKDLMCSFDKPGKYEISFDNQKVKEVYAHRKPVADFNINIQSGTLTLTSTSYDLDSETDIGYGEGIAEEAWYYKEATADTWTSGKLSQFTANKVYMIKLEVTDEQGVTSSAIKYVGIGAPVANFTLSSNAISTADKLSVMDVSYDPQGYELTGYEWTLKKGETVLQTYTSKQFPDINYNDPAFGEGNYSISLKVTNSNGMASGVFTQFFTVETARYNNKYVHYAGGFQANEGGAGDDGSFLLQTTYRSQTYGTEFLPNADYALSLPNGFYLEPKFGTGQMEQEDGAYQEYDFGTKVNQPGYAMDFAYHYYPYEYTLTYDLDGGVLEEENPQTYTVLHGVTFQEPVKPHCTFLGWYDQDGNKLTGVNEGANAVFTNTADLYSKLAPRKTGNLQLTAKWETRTYDVTAVKYGHGTISGGGRFVEGEESTVTWTPDEGYKVTSVMVDGDVRDDLVNGGAGNTIRFADIQESHVVKVEFAEKKADNDDDGEEEDRPQYFTVTTEQKGGSGEAVISKSKTLAEGSDYIVEWQPGGMDVIQSITVDGQDYPTDKRSVEFKKLAGNHHVVVVYEMKETPERPTTDGYYTITVNTWNGDAGRVNTAVTGNGVVQPGTDHTVTWMAQGSYEVSGIVLDRGTAAEKCLTADEIAAGSYTFADVRANHVVDVTFQDTAQNPDDPQPKKVQVTTELVGSPGQITESATVNVGDNYTVEWDSVVRTTDDVEDSDYAVYKVKEVLVNDQQMDADTESANLTNIREDQTVRVVMEPVLYQVETEIVGGGSIAPTKTLYDGQNYLVTAAPIDGWILQSVTVDGNLEYEKPETVMVSDEEAEADVENNVPLMKRSPARAGGEVTTVVNDQAV
ncbi:MAG: InlB B-repeat-containing protein [Lachnospiraceae bacterium]